MRDFITVSALNHLAGSVLRQCEPLNDLIVCGEISNFTRHYKSGHLYFSLKDESCSVKAVMFRENARLLGFDPQPGMQVLAYGHAALYERDGAFQLYVDFMRPFGAGAAQIAFDALKSKLEKEGLFDLAHKRPLPMPPRCIGVVTSKTGAALQDVIHVISRRWPLTKLLLAPVSVQGLEAETSIVAGIRALDADERPDVILVTRGGGSKEDLWVFNSERIARAAYACHKPVVSAVGHEIDYTILDYVADLRAPTPSAAAELCVPDRMEAQQKIFILSKNIQENMQRRYQIWYNAYEEASGEQLFRCERARWEEACMRFEELRQGITAAAHSQVQKNCAALSQQTALAASLNPYGVLARGYCLAKDNEKNCVRVSELHSGQPFVLEDAGAVADCTVQRVEYKKRGRNESTEKF
ncbi:MAG: exodeoxyribonuclease VII large subunit [Gemmiger sp.]